jgi:nickel transport protein
MRDPLRQLMALACLALLGTATAHTLRLFAAVEGGDVTGLAFFADGARARDVPVVLQVAGTVVAEVRTDAEGRFRFVAPDPVAARIEATTADGHRTTWDVPASAWGVAVVPDRAEAPTAAAPTTAAEPVPAQDLAAMEARIEAAIARQVDRLREDLALAESRRRVADVVGGVGYLFGVTGLATLLLRRKPR